MWSTARSASSDADGAPVAPTLTMHTWLDQSRVSINSVVSARNTIAAAAARQDIRATGVACEKADESLADLREHMPSPDAAVNQPLQQAISSYTMGLPDCVSASRTVSGEGMQRAAGLISIGDAAMQLVLDVLADDSDPQTSNLGVLIV